MKKVLRAIAAALALLCLTACGRQEKVLYEGDYLTVIRVGRATIVCDEQNGLEYRYTSKRDKRRRDVTEAHTAETITETSNLIVKTAQGVLVITSKADGQTVIIPNRSH